MTREEAPSFQFYPRDFVSSRAVSLMTPEQRGGYIMLLCHAWMSEEPGTLPADDPTLATLSGLGDRWTACREPILRAFDFGSPDGPPTILQVRMIEEREKQIRRYRQAAKGARLTNAVKRTKHAQRDDSDTDSERSATALASAFASASAFEARELEPRTLGQTTTTNGHENGDLTPLEWFEKEFWPRYPRKVKKPAAKRAMLALFKATPPSRQDDLGDALLDGLERYCQNIAGKESEFVSHPATWIHNHRWEDESS